MDNSKLPFATYSWVLPFGFIAHFGGPAYDLESPTKRAVWLKSLPHGPSSWVMPKQQHGPLVLTDFNVSEKLENFCDGLATNNMDIGLGVFGSDCPGVAVVAPDALGLAHCGWRGISKGVIENLVSSVLKVSKFSTAELCGFIGPGICQSCYEVKGDLLAAYNWPESSLQRRLDGTVYLSLSDVITSLFMNCGVSEVLFSDVCTSCAPDAHSNRHQGPGVVQVFALYKQLLG
ncbi:polyphenol oxidase family protein [Pseudomonas syringae]|uniref:polyphenol oxidase family protein n=1 Tax=Pseudomonas syringae TaxID=317 RepID=UPI003F873ABD